MPDSPPDVFARLEAAVSRWNARVGGAYQELRQAIDLSRKKLDTVDRLLATRRSLSTTLVVARAKLDALNQDPGEREAAVSAAVARIAVLEQSLAAYHVELQTLNAQLGRTLAAGDVLAEELLRLQEEKGASLLGVDAPAAPAGASAAVAAAGPDHAAKLQAQVAALRGEVDALRAKLAERGAPAPLPPVSSREAELAADLESARLELAALRMRVGEAGFRSGKPHEELSRLHTELEAARQKSAGFKSRNERIRSLSYDAEGKKRPMGAILVQAGVISEHQLESALREQRTSWNRHLGAILVGLGYATEDVIAQTLAAQTQLPFVRLADLTFENRALTLVNGQLAHHHTCIPVHLDGGRLVVAMANPLDLVALEDLQLAANRHIKPVVAPAQEIRSELSKRYPHVRI